MIDHNKNNQPFPKNLDLIEPLEDHDRKMYESQLEHQYDWGDKNCKTQQKRECCVQAKLYQAENDPLTYQQRQYDNYIWCDKKSGVYPNEEGIDQNQWSNQKYFSGNNEFRLNQMQNLSEKDNKNQKLLEFTPEKSKHSINRISNMKKVKDFSVERTPNRINWSYFDYHKGYQHNYNRELIDTDYNKSPGKDYLDRKKLALAKSQHEKQTSGSYNNMAPHQKGKC